MPDAPDEKPTIPVKMMVNFAPTGKTFRCVRCGNRLPAKADSWGVRYSLGVRCLCGRLYRIEMGPSGCSKCGAERRGVYRPIVIGWEDPPG